MNSKKFTDIIIGKVTLILCTIVALSMVVNTVKEATTDASPMKQLADESEAEFNKIRAK